MGNKLSKREKAGGETEALKGQGVSDPVGNMGGTEGFEAQRDALSETRTLKGEMWEAYGIIQELNSKIVALQKEERLLQRAKDLVQQHIQTLEQASVS